MIPKKLPKSQTLILKQRISILKTKPMKYTFLFFIFLSVNIDLYCQTPVIKKEKTITTYFYHDGHSIVDSFIQEYSSEGLPIKDNKYTLISPLDIISRDSTITKSKSPSLLHQREFWSDSSIVDIYTKFQKKYFEKIYIKKDDTISIRKAFFKKRRIQNIDFKYFEKLVQDEIFMPYELTLFFETKKDITCFTRHKNSPQDSSKIKNITHKKRHEIWKYNPEKKEWFVNKKVVNKRSKKIIWDTSFHEYHKEYYTRKQIVSFNKFGQIIEIMQYDAYSLPERKEQFIFEYY